MPLEAWFLSLAAAFLFGLGFVVTQFGLRHLTPALGAVFSMPTAAVLFWAAAPVFADFSGFDADAAALFAVVGLFFPAAITLLTFEANRLMGPYVSGALGNLAPVFAVAAALVFLGEVLGAAQWIAVAVIVAGVSCLSLRRSWQQQAWSRWLMVLPLGAALCRGLGPPALKIGLDWWPQPYVAVMICYAVSAAVAISVGLWRTRNSERHITRRGICWFAGVGLCNGFAVLSWTVALSLGPVSLISPMVASYPVFTLALGAAFLGRTALGFPQIAGVLLTVGGIVLLIGV